VAIQNWSKSPKKEQSSGAVEETYLLIWVVHPHPAVSTPIFEEYTTDDPSLLPEVGDSFNQYQLVSISKWEPYYDVLIKKGH
jgi:hypothetical protein